MSTTRRVIGAVAFVGVLAVGVYLGRGLDSATASPEPGVNAPPVAPLHGPVRARLPEPNPATLTVHPHAVNGSGVRTLPAFHSTGRWSISYAYTCSKPGRFVLSDGGPYWSVVFVDATALTGSGRIAETVTGLHRVGVNSTCRWSVRVDR